MSELLVQLDDDSSSGDDVPAMGDGDGFGFGTSSLPSSRFPPSGAAARAGLDLRLGVRSEQLLEKIRQATPGETPRVLRPRTTDTTTYAAAQFSRFDPTKPRFSKQQQQKQWQREREHGRAVQREANAHKVLDHTTPSSLDSGGQSRLAPRPATSAGVRTRRKLGPMPATGRGGAPLVHTGTSSLADMMRSHDGLPSMLLSATRPATAAVAEHFAAAPEPSRGALAVATRSGKQRGRSTGKGGKGEPQEDGILDSGAGLLLGPWLRSFEAELEHFDSTAVFCEVRLREALRATSSMGAPNRVHTAVVVGVLAKVVGGELFGRYSSLMQVLYAELLRAIYHGDDVIASPNAPFGTDAEAQLLIGEPYYEQVHHLESENEGLHHHLEQWREGELELSRVLTRAQHTLRLAIKSWQKLLVRAMFEEWATFVAMRRAQRLRLGRRRKRIWFDGWRRRTLRNTLARQREVLTMHDEKHARLSKVHAIELQRLLEQLRASRDTQQKLLDRAKKLQGGADAADLSRRAAARAMAEAASARAAFETESAGLRWRLEELTEAAAAAQRARDLAQRERDSALAQLRATMAGVEKRDKKLSDELARVQSCASCGEDTVDHALVVLQLQAAAEELAKQVAAQLAELRAQCEAEKARADKAEGRCRLLMGENSAYTVGPPESGARFTTVAEAVQAATKTSGMVVIQPGAYRELVVLPPTGVTVRAAMGKERRGDAAAKDGTSAEMGVALAGSSSVPASMQHFIVSGEGANASAGGRANGGGSGNSGGGGGGSGGADLASKVQSLERVVARLKAERDVERTARAKAEVREAAAAVRAAEAEAEAASFEAHAFRQVQSGAANTKELERMRELLAEAQARNAQLESFAFRCTCQDGGNIGLIAGAYSGADGGVHGVGSGGMGGAYGSAAAGGGARGSSDLQPSGGDAYGADAGSGVAGGGSSGGGADGDGGGKRGSKDGGRKRSKGSKSGKSGTLKGSGAKGGGVGKGGGSKSGSKARFFVVPDSVRVNTAVASAKDRASGSGGPLTFSFVLGNTASLDGLGEISGYRIEWINSEDVSDASTGEQAFVLLAETGQGAAEVPGSVAAAHDAAEERRAGKGGRVRRLTSGAETALDEYLDACRGGESLPAVEGGIDSFADEGDGAVCETVMAKRIFGVSALTLHGHGLPAGKSVRLRLLPLMRNGAGAGRPSALTPPVLVRGAPQARSGGLVLTTSEQRLFARIWGADFALGGGVKPKTSRWLHSFIAELYGRKVVADAVDDRERNARDDLPRYLRAHLETKYGVRKLADEHLRGVIACLRAEGVDKHDDEHLTNHPRLQLFAILAGIADPQHWCSSACDIMLELLGACIPAKHMGSTLASAAGTCFVALATAIDAVDLVFPGTVEEEQELALHKKHALSKSHGFGASAGHKAAVHVKLRCGQVLRDKLHEDLELMAVGADELPAASQRRGGICDHGAHQ